MAGRSQFSIRFLLVATVVVGAAVAAVGTARAKPSWQTAMTMAGLTLLFLTAAIIGAVQTSAGVRAFWIGAAVAIGAALIPASHPLWVMLSYMAQDWNAVGRLPPGVASGGFFWPFWCAAPINGLFAVFIHWLFVPHKDAA